MKSLSIRMDNNDRKFGVLDDDINWRWDPWADKISVHDLSKYHDINPIFSDFIGNNLEMIFRNQIDDGVNPSLRNILFLNEIERPVINPIKIIRIIDVFIKIGRIDVCVGKINQINLAPRRIDKGVIKMIGTEK